MRIKTARSLAKNSPPASPNGSPPGTPTRPASSTKTSSATAWTATCPPPTPAPSPAPRDSRRLRATEFDETQISDWVAWAAVLRCPCLSHFQEHRHASTPSHATHFRHLFFPPALQDQ